MAEMATRGHGDQDSVDYILSEYAASLAKYQPATEKEAIEWLWMAEYSNTARRKAAGLEPMW